MLDFATEIDATVCWYQVTAGDEDIKQFGRYMVAAFRQKFKHFGEEVERLLNAPGSTLSPQSLATALLNEMIQAVDDFCVLFLDDFHVVGETQPVVDLMEVLLEHLPEQVRLVVASRSVYGIPTPRLYVRNQLATINVDDLRFQPDEIVTLVRQKHHFSLPLERAEEFAARSDGWIVAILLAVRSLSSGRLFRLEGFSADQVYEFLAREVIERESEQLRNFMMATSILDEFTEPLASHLLEEPSTKDLILELESRNLFVTRVETSEGASYRYHQLFADFLRTQLASSNVEWKQALHHRAAQWYWKRGQWEAAISHMLQTGDREAAAAWMDSAARHVFLAGHSHLLSQWVEALKSPTNLCEQAPQLLLHQAKVFINQGTYEAGENLLSVIEPIFRRYNDLDSLVNTLLARCVVRQNMRQFHEALILANEVQEILKSEKEGKGEDEPTRWFQAERIKGFCLGQLGKFEEAIMHLTRAVSGLKEQLKSTTDETRRIQILHDLGVVLTDLGIIHFENSDMLAAQTCMQESLHFRRKSRTNVELIAKSLNNTGYLYYQTGQYRAAWEAYQEAEEILGKIDLSRGKISLLNSMGDLLRDLDEWEAAKTTYNKAIEQANRLHIEEAGYAARLGLSDLARLKGDFPQAFHWLREAARVRNLNTGTPAYKAKLGKIYLEMGQPELAVIAFEESLRQWENAKGVTQEHAETAFYLSYALFLQGQTEAALQQLKRALRWAAQLGYDQFLVVAGRRTQPLLDYALHAWPDHSQIKSLYERVQSFQTGLAQFQTQEETEKPLGIHLEVLALGPSQIRRNGELLSKSEWQSSKPRALVCFLVEKGSQRSSDIKLNFWPEFGPNKANTNLQATIWRARKALGGKEFLINEGDQYQLAPEVTIWYDVAEFRNHVFQARQPNLSPFERVEHWRQAVALYQGDYLEDIFMDWTNELRNELRTMYLETLTSLAEWETEQQRYPQAKILYEKALALDSYRDDIHLAYMQCMEKAGSRSAAIAHYLNTKKKMEQDGMEPSPSLRLYYDQLVNSA